MTITVSGWPWAEPAPWYADWCPGKPVTGPAGNEDEAPLVVAYLDAGD